MKILIVDDEVLERKVVSKIINSSLEGVTVIGEAPNGRRAIEMAEEYQPNIIFMDIKMPGIDGIQAVKAIRQKQPDVKFIMVSAFNTFEYAKEVMQQGVKEYILKPSSKQDILAAVQRVSAEILEERQQQEERQSLRANLERAVSIAQKEWVSSLLLNPMQDITFDEWGQLLGIEITSGYIMLFSFQQMDGTTVSASEKRQWYVWLKNTIKAISNKQETMVGPITDLQVPVLFLCKQTTERVHFKASAQTLIESIFNSFRKELFQAELRVGVGLPYHHAQELNKSYHEAAVALQQLAKIPNQKYFFSGKQEPVERSSPSVFFEIEKKLLDSIRQGDIKQVLLVFDSFVSKNFTDTAVNASAMKQFFEELFILISRMLHELEIRPEQALKLEFVDMRAMIEECKTHLVAVARQVQAWRNNHAKGMLYKAKEYIEKHYADLITLESTAEYVDLSPYYFSKLFKDRFGLTFIDYVTEVRIQRAKTEMADPTKSLKEICFSVGYKDPNYFSRVFKKSTGISPTQFRKAVLGDDSEIE